MGAHLWPWQSGDGDKDLAWRLGFFKKDIFLNHVLCFAWGKEWYWIISAVYARLVFEGGWQGVLRRGWGKGESFHIPESGVQNKIRDEYPETEDIPIFLEILKSQNSSQQRGSSGVHLFWGNHVCCRVLYHVHFLLSPGKTSSLEMKLLLPWGLTFDGSRACLDHESLVTLSHSNRDSF